MDTDCHFEHLLPLSWKTQVASWLTEDTPSFDYGGYVVGEAYREAFLYGKGKQPAVLAGSPFFTEVFSQLGCVCVPDSPTPRYGNNVFCMTA
jgi:nicotinate-nucleotide pyrophosphorylase (carboxylating)